MNKILILEPSTLTYNRTHNFASLLNYSSVFQNDGIQVFWMPNKHCTVELPGVSSFPKFSYTIYEDFFRKKSFVFGKQVYIYAETKRQAGQLSETLVTEVLASPHPAFPMKNDFEKGHSLSGETSIHVGVLGRSSG